MAIKKQSTTKKVETKKEIEPKIKKVKKLTFSDEDVDALEPLEAIRVRSDMYIGSKEPVTHMVKELLDNSIDEFLNGFCSDIEVIINSNENSIIVKDNGRGLPVSIHPKFKKPTIEILFMHVHSGAKYNKNSVKVSAGKNGVGIKTLTACSDFLEVTSNRDGVQATMGFAKGKITKPFATKKIKNKDTGTTIKFIPDSTLFEADITKINPERIKEIIELKCYLNAGLKILLRIDDVEEVIQYNSGLSEFLNKEAKTPLYNMENIIFSDKDSEDNEYEFALIFENSTDEKILSFVNSLPTLRGTHEVGYKKGLTKAFNEYIKTNGLLNKKGDKAIQIKGEDIRRGIVTIISLKHAFPLFDSQTKSELTNREIDGIVSGIVFKNMNKWFEENPIMAKKLCERAVAFARATNNAKDAMKKIIKVSSSGMGLSITEKFKDCTSDNPDEIEIIVIEGDSAAGNVEQGRFSEFQCIFPLKGKIKNTYRNKQNSLINNNEINEFLKIMFGTNDITKIDFNKIKGKKIIIMTDADPDGSHICILFLNFLYEHLPELIERGYVYIGLSPFYRVQVSKDKWQYFMNDYEYNNFVSEVIGKKYKVLNDKSSVKKIMTKSSKYLDEYKRIMHKKSIDSEIMNIFLRNESREDIIKELKEAKLSVKDNNVEGLYNNIWHSFTIDELSEELVDLADIYPFTNITLLDKSNNEEFECDLYDGILELKKQFKYNRNRIKGLGELDGLELKETSLHPEKRTLIQVKSKKDETELELFKILFGPNPDLRKDFIGKYLL